MNKPNPLSFIHNNLLLVPGNKEIENRPMSARTMKTAREMGMSQWEKNEPNSAGLNNKNSRSRKTLKSYLILQKVLVLIRLIVYIYIYI